MFFLLGCPLYLGVVFYELIPSFVDLSTIIHPVLQQRVWMALDFCVQVSQSWSIIFIVTSVCYKSMKFVLFLNGACCGTGSPAPKVGCCLRCRYVTRYIRIGNLYRMFSRLSLPISGFSWTRAPLLDVYNEVDSLVDGDSWYWSIKDHDGKNPPLIKQCRLPRPVTTNENITTNSSGIIMSYP